MQLNSVMKLYARLSKALWMWFRVHFFILWKGRTGQLAVMELEINGVELVASVRHRSDS